MDYWLEFTPSYKICKLFSRGRKTGDRRVRITPIKSNDYPFSEVGDFRLKEWIIFKSEKVQCPSFYCDAFLYA
jgi:hypothetical protein